MSGRHQAGPAESWSDGWLTADEARAIRADEAARAIGSSPVRMPLLAYTALETARDRAAYLEIIRANRRARLRRALFWAAVAALFIAGCIGLALTDPVPGIG